MHDTYLAILGGGEVGAAGEGFLDLESRGIRQWH